MDIEVIGQQQWMNAVNNIQNKNKKQPQKSPYILNCRWWFCNWGDNLEIILSWNFKWSLGKNELLILKISLYYKRVGCHWTLNHQTYFCLLALNKNHFMLACSWTHRQDHTLIKIKLNAPPIRLNNESLDKAFLALERYNMRGTNMAPSNKKQGL